MRQEDGGITVEAALVMPLVMTFLLAMITCMQLLMIEMSLQASTSETVKYVAAHMYAAQLAFESKSAQQLKDGVDEWLAPIGEWTEALRPFEDMMPKQIKEIVFLQDTLKDQTIKSVEYLCGQAMLSLMKMHNLSPWIKPEHIKVTYVHMPMISQDSDDILRFTTEYTFPVRLPFYQRDFIIRATAAERVWIGG